MTVSLNIAYNVGQLVTGFSTGTVLCGVHLINLFWLDIITSSMY